jgi:hypothetical protein
MNYAQAKSNVQRINWKALYKAIAMWRYSTSRIYEHGSGNVGLAPNAQIFKDGFEHPFPYSNDHETWYKFLNFVQAYI